MATKRHIIAKSTGAWTESHRPNPVVTGKVTAGPNDTLGRAVDLEVEPRDLVSALSYACVNDEGAANVEKAVRDLFAQPPYSWSGTTTLRGIIIDAVAAYQKAQQD